MCAVVTDAELSATSAQADKGAPFDSSIDGMVVPYPEEAMKALRNFYDESERPEGTKVHVQLFRDNVNVSFGALEMQLPTISQKLGDCKLGASATDSKTLARVGTFYGAHPFYREIPRAIEALETLDMQGM